MAAQNGTLRLVAGNAEPKPVGVGSPRSDAYAAMLAQGDKLKALVDQQSNTGLSNQLAVFGESLSTYVRSVDAEIAGLSTPTPAPPAQQGQTVPYGDYLDAEKLVQQLKLELQKLGYTFTPANQPVPPTNLAKSTAPSGTYTTGQVGSVGVAGALLGWVGHGLWEDYQRKHGR